MIYAQLGPDHSDAGRLARIVGELHDNVASHASGAGFSSAQVYQQGDGKKRLEYAIADIGCGIFYNAGRASSGAKSHSEAISWAIQKGSTSAKKRDDWAQRLPDDTSCSPYPDNTDTFYDENHHLGLGLYELTEVVRSLNGQAIIYSGDGLVKIEDGEITTSENGYGGFCWDGVMIEFEVLVDAEHSAIGKSTSHDALRKRLGL